MDGAVGKVLGVKLTAFKPHALMQIKEALTFDNPAYEPGGDEPAVLCAYEVKQGIIYLPRSFPVQQYAEKPLEIQSRLTEGHPIQVTSNITPEAYQERPIKLMTKLYDDGILVAPCGAGKTVMGIDVIAKHGRKALVLVMTEFLMGQWADEILKFTDAKIGFIGGSSAFRASYRRHSRVVAPEVADIVVATIQTLVSGVSAEFCESVGTVIGDEAHHAAARTFMTVLKKFKPKHLYGVTATPKRSDGLEEIYFHFIGPVICEVKQAELRKHSRTIMPKIQFVLTGLFPKLDIGPGYHHAIALRILTKNEARNKIIQKLARTSESKGRWTLVLSERVDHCVALCDEYRKAGGDGAVVTGQIGSIEDAFTHRVVFATYALVTEGLNQKQLNTLILATPFSSESRMVQAVGRVVRALEDKTGALVFDLVDEAKVFQRMALKREAACQAQGWVTKWIQGV